MISFALKNGYRLIDTAKNYGNEKEVGEGIVRSGVKRSDLFVTTKLWIEDFGYDEALRAFDRSLNALELEYLDLYLLHWPVPTDFNKTIAAYKAMEKLYADKRIRAIGVSNFQPEHLKRLMDNIELGVEDMAALDALNRDLRGGPNPEHFDVPAFRAIMERRNSGV